MQPISSAIIRASMAYCVLVNRASVLTSAADDTTNLMIWAMFNTALLFFRSFASSDINAELSKYQYSHLGDIDSSLI